MTKTAYHVSMNIEQALSLTDDQLLEIFKGDNGETLAIAEIRGGLKEGQRKGWEVITGCDNVGEKGHCLGHPYEPDPTAEALWELAVVGLMEAAAEVISAFPDRPGRTSAELSALEGLSQALQKLETLNNESYATFSHTPAKQAT